MPVTGKLVTYLGKGTTPAPVQPQPTVGGPPRNLVTGCTARSWEQGSGPLRNLIDGCVIQLTWRECQPTNGASLDATVMARVISQLDWCAANLGTSGRPIRARLRIEAGIFSPDWVKALPGVGEITPWYASLGGNATGPAAPSDPKWRQTPNSLLCYWKQPAIDAYKAWIVLLAAAIGDHPALGEVTMALPMTNYVEPFLKEFFCQENREGFIANGWTQELDTHAFIEGWQVHEDTFGSRGVGCYTAFNPAQEITFPAGGGTGARSDTAYTIAMMERKIAIAGRHAVIANNSVMSPINARGAEYVTQYNRMIAGRAQASPFPWPIAFQSATLDKIRNNYLDKGTTVHNTIEMLRDWGATGMELPIGCQATTAGESYLTPTQARAYNTAFWNQSQTLMASTVPAGAPV